MRNHTRGPWTGIGSDLYHTVYIEDALGNREDVDAGCATSDANRDLILAAPELLEALEILTSCLENGIALLGEDPADDARIKMARAAIAKATGDIQ